MLVLRWGHDNPHAPGTQLSAQDVYDIWRIRDQVFAFEQHVEDVDVDGLDLLADDDAPVGGR